METSEQHSEARASPPTETHLPTGVLASSRILRPRDLQIYRACETGTEGLIYWMVVFTPWAFGTTQPWAIRTMDVAGYLLGLLLALKLWVRWHKGYRPARWGRNERSTEGTAESRKQKAENGKRGTESEKGKAESGKLKWTTDHRPPTTGPAEDGHSPLPSALNLQPSTWAPPGDPPAKAAQT